jgi:hypothetical protein
MPPQDRGRLNDVGQTEQAWPEPSHPYQQCPVTPPQPQTVWSTSQGNIQLVPKKEVLDFKPAPRRSRQTSQADRGWQASRRMML